MKSYDEILQEMLIDFATELGVDVISSASDIAIKAKVLAGQIEGLFYNQDYSLDQAFPQTAVGERLDQHAYIFKVDRKQATKSTGKVKMGRSSAYGMDIIIPKGTLFSTLENKDGEIIKGETTEDATLIAGELFVEINGEAIEEGVQGNVSAGEFVVLNNPPTGIEYVTNLLPFTGGTDRENDEMLRKRLLESIRKPSLGGTSTDYENWALEVDGVTLAKCLPLNRGAGTVDVLIGTSTGQPSDILVQTVYDYIQTKRPIGADVQVVKPQIVTIDVTVQITPKAGYTISTLTDLIQTAVETYINNIEVGGVVKISALINVVYDVTGVDDVQIISPAQNIELTGTQIAQAGVINVQ